MPTKMKPTRKPGDIGQLGRYDPLDRDNSNLPWGSGPNQTPEEARRSFQNYNESARREFRQSEDAGSGKWMKDSKHTVVDGSENKG